ncbi:IgGFc-binding protein-like [Aquarana catesbeiana]|uniref:IgGFc-binding protein-like n=1 Tax=Aquarana catesbeiana TaxID=8400 RepID=UPI003CCA2287
MENLYVSEATTFQLYLVTYDKPATVTVTVSQPEFNQTIHIERDNYALVTLNYNYMITEKHVTYKAVLVQSDAALSVFGFNKAHDTADAMTCLPVEDLGTEYYISTPASGTEKQFAVANGLEDTALVNVTVSGSIVYNGVEYTKGQSFSFSLRYQQSIQFQSSSDLTGTRISSTVPVAVFSGQKFLRGIISSCDNLVEQLYPVSKWGHFFVLVPLLNHAQDSVTVVTSSSETRVFVDSAVEPREHFIENAGTPIRISLKEMSTINASKPIMVTYLLQDQNPGAVVANYDPFFVTIPPSLVTRSSYKFVTQKIYFNYLLIVTQATSADGFYLDHRPLNLYSFSIQHFRGYSAFNVFLDKSEGQHDVYHDSTPFTIYVYGLEKATSYGYSMGQETIYPDESLPTPTEGSEPEGTLHCLSNGAEYQLPLSMVVEAHLDVSDIHLEDPLCQAVAEEDFAFIQIPFSECGSNVLSEDGKTYYENTVYGTIPRTSIHRIEIPVKCAMQMNETLGMNLHPKVTDVVSLGHYNVSLQLYPSEKFSDLITTYPYEVDIHGHLYVEFKVVSSDQSLQILLITVKLLLH